MLWPLLLACTGGPSAEGSDPSVPDPRDRPFDEQVLLVAHNGFNSTAMGFPVANQTLDYEDQLELGVRGFMMDVYGGAEVGLDEPVLCHGACLLGSQPLGEALARVDAWLLDHPDELVVFVIQDETDPDDIAAAFVAQGLDQRAILPPADGAWPSWNELVADGRQVLVSTEGRHEGQPDWFVWTYGIAWDNPYAAQTVDDFACEPLRGDPGHPLFLLNHFLTAPIASQALAEAANEGDVLREHIARCEAEAGQQVNWIAVDFVAIGDAPEVVQELQAR
jgi:hypothetical protein